MSLKGILMRFVSDASLDDMSKNAEWRFVWRLLRCLLILVVVLIAYNCAAYFYFTTSEKSRNIRNSVGEVVTYRLGGQAHDGVLCYSALSINWMVRQRVVIVRMRREERFEYEFLLSVGLDPWELGRVEIGEATGQLEQRQ
jgi:hypothetical protein